MKWPGPSAIAAREPATFATTLTPPISSPAAVAAWLQGWGSDTWDTGDFATEPVISRAAAITVPVVSAGRDLIVGTLAPLELQLRKGEVNQPLPSLLQRPDPRMTRYEWLAWVLDDLIFEGQSVCLIRARDFGGFPSALERIDPLTLEHVKDDQWRAGDELVSASDLIRFGGGSDGVRYSGRRVLRTALRLEQAARIDAETPVPPVVLENSGPDLTDAQKTSLLDGWRKARQATGGGVGYLNQSMKATTLGWSSADRQLVEGRRYVAVEVARLLGLDASDLDAAMSGSSVTYQNTVSQVRNRLQRLAGYRAAIEQRFSMPDLTPRGYTVRIDTDPISTDELATRYEAYSTAIAAGFLTVDEVRTREGLDPMKGAKP